MSSVQRARVRPDPRHGYRPGTLLGVLAAFAAVITIVLVSVGITQATRRASPAAVANGRAEICTTSPRS